MTNDRDRFLDELEDLEGELDATDVLAALAGQQAPPPQVRDRLMQSIAQPGRLWRFADRIGELLDVAVETAKDYLVGVDSADNFAPAPFPQGALYHVESGPAAASAITGFIKMPPQAVFPEHEHLGEEIVFIVQGRIQDSDGTIFGPGAEIRKQKGTSHSFTVLDGAPLIYLAVVHGGLKIGGEVFYPGDPRI